MLKTKKGFLLRRLGKEFMVVAIGDASKDFNGMIRLNETGAFFWDELKNGIEFDALVDKMLERFNGLDRATAESDLKEFLDSIAFTIENV